MALAPPTEVLGIVEVRPQPAPDEQVVSETDRSVFASGLATTVDFSPRWVASNAGISALLLLLLVAAAQLFNDTLKAHHERIAGWFGDRSSAVGRARAALAGLPHPPPLALFALVAALLGLLADPNLVLGVNTLAQMTGMGVAVAVIVTVYDGTAARLVRRETGIVPRFRLYPIAIAVAVACLSMSRFMHVAPGVLYGLIMGVVFAGSVDASLEGRAYARSSAYLVGAALAAYLVHRVVGPDAAGPSPGWWVIVVDSAAAALFVGGLQAVIVQLLPTRFVNGEKVASWSRVGWFLLLAGTLSLYLQLVVRPSQAAQSWSNLWFVAGLVGLAVAFWAWGALSGHRSTAPEPDRLEELLDA